MVKKQILLALLALGAAILSSACGGGGSAAGSGGLRLFLTDTFRDDYDNVFLTLHKIEYRNAETGQFTSAWSSDAGVVVDAKRLRDLTGERYAFLALASIPAGSYDAVRLTLGADATLVQAGSGQVHSFDSSLPRDGTGKPMVLIALNPALSVSGTSNFVLDIDLANWSLNGSNQIVPSFRRGSGNGLDDSGRHEPLEYKGTVSNLTSTRFTLQPLSGASIQVAYTDRTPIYRRSTGAPAILSNGQLVEVRGVFQAGILQASVIKIEDNGGGGSGEHEARGRHINVDLGSNTMQLTDLTEIEGFLPRNSTINVTWDSNTFFRRSGVQVDENALTQWQFSEVKGTYDPNTNTLHATRITLEDDGGGGGGGGGGEAEATGTITNVNLDANTMTLTNIFNVEGFTPQGTTVNVTWTEETIFRRGGNQVTEQALLQFPRAEAKGVYDPATNTIRASRIKLED
jgi:hypothetical protein